MYLPDAVATILDAQWVEMQTRQHVIDNMRDMNISMCHDLNDADISTTQRHVFSNVSSTCSDSVQSNCTVESVPDFTAVPEVASPPECPLPSWKGYNKGYFPWQAPLHTGMCLSRNLSFIYARQMCYGSCGEPMLP